MGNESVDMDGAVVLRPNNKDYDTLQVDIKALPYKRDGETTRLWLNGQEIRNVKSVCIDAGTHTLALVRLEFYANVTGQE